MNEFKSMNWQERIETNELKRMISHEWFVDLIFKKCEKKTSVVDGFDVINYLMTMWSTDDMKLWLHPRTHFVDLMVDLIFKKWSDVRFVLRFWCEIELSLPSRAHFEGLIFKKRKDLEFFDDFFVINYLMTMWSTDEMKLSLQPRTRFVDLMVNLIFKKWPDAVRFLCEIELALQSRAHFVDLIFKKWSDVRFVLRFWCEIELSLPSRAHFEGLIFKKCKDLEFFDDFFVINYLMTMWSTDEMKLSLQPRTRFVDLMVNLIFKKWPDAVRFLCEIELALQSRAHFVDLIFKKWSDVRFVLRFWCEIELSLPSRAHFEGLIFKKRKDLEFFDDFFVINYLMTMWSTDEMKLSLQPRTRFVDLMVNLIFKKWPDAVSFLRFLCEIELALQSRAHFVDLIFKKWSDVRFVLRFWCEIELALQSRAHFWRPHLQKVQRLGVFWRFFCDQLFDDDVVDRWNEALAAAAHTLCRPHGQPHLQKVARCCQFLTISMWNRACSTVSCTWCRPHLQECKKRHFSRYVCEIELSHALATVSFTFCRPLSGSRSAPAETETLQRRPRTATLPEKTQGFAPGNLFSREFRVLRPRVFSAVNSRIPDRSHFPTAWWWCDWHDDVVDMILRQLAVRIVRNSEAS